MNAARVLGVVLAGGRSTRFGSDKALARVAGRTLLAHAVDCLAAQCDAVAIVGRAVADDVAHPVIFLADRPRPDMGPLGGLAAALHHAREAGYDNVLSCSVDSLGLATGLLAELGPAPAHVADQPVIGLWPADAAPTLDALLASEGRHSMLAFAAAIRARRVELAAAPANINTPADLLAAEERHRAR